MGTLKEKVERVISEELPGAELDLEYIPEAEKISGDVTWSGFSGKTQKQRYDILQKALKKRLTDIERRNLSIIMPFSPAETRARIVHSAFP